MKARTNSNLFKAISLSIFLSLVGLFSPAQEKCSSIYSSVIPSFEKAVLHEELQDITTTNVFLGHQDVLGVASVFKLNLRPDFLLAVHRTSDGRSILSLVAKKRGTNLSQRQQLVGQQVVQWQKLDIVPEDILGIVDHGVEGRVKILINKKSRFGFKYKTELKTQIVLARPLNVNPTSYDDLMTYLRDNPRNENSNRKKMGSDLLRFLFGRAWVKILGPKADLNSLNDSKKILKTQDVIVKNKVKNLHVVGQIFTGELNISSASPYTGHLSPGRYYVVGRLSSGMKNLDIQGANGDVEKNSLAMGLLVFKSKSDKEQPGLLFVQDSLMPLKNPGLSQYQLTNNPGFKFKPGSIREFLEQGFTVFGVGLASLLNSADSGRSVQGNYRSTLGMATSSVDLSRGEAVVAPRYIALQFNGSYNPSAKTYVESLSSDPHAQFILRVSDDGQRWADLGSLEQIQWAGIDSHELTFPHGLSGTINPQVLRPANSIVGIRGLELPIEITPHP